MDHKDCSGLTVEEIESLCSCGKKYGNGNCKPRDCPAFLKYRELTEFLKFNNKINKNESKT